jgi:hypothetical protein
MFSRGAPAADTDPHADCYAALRELVRVLADLVEAQDTTLQLYGQTLADLAHKVRPSAADISRQRQLIAKHRGELDKLRVAVGEFIAHDTNTEERIH